MDWFRAPRGEVGELFMVKTSCCRSVKGYGALLFAALPGLFPLSSLP